MTGPEDFPATDVLSWEQSTVDRAFAGMTAGVRTDADRDIEALADAVMAARVEAAVFAGWPPMGYRRRYDWWARADVFGLWAVAALVAVICVTAWWVR